MPAGNTTPSKRQPLLVLGKIIEILDAFSFSRPAMTLGEIQQATGIPASTVQRLVGNMTDHGLLDRSGDTVRIGVRMAYWAATATKDLDVLAITQPVLNELRDKTGETATLFRVEQDYRVCVAIAETHHPLRRQMYVGKIAPLTVGSAGRVLLAYDGQLFDRVTAKPLEALTDATITDRARLRALVDETRIQGYAVTVGERDSAGSGLSAPIFDSAAVAIGAVTVSGPTLRMPLKRCLEWVDVVVAAAEQITRTLGGRPPQ